MIGRMIFDGRPWRAALVILAAILVALAIDAGADGLVRPAEAQPQFCAPRAGMVERLLDKYGESRVSYGLTSRGTVLEVFASAGGSWTVIESSPQGTSCARAAGEGWQRLDLPKALADPA